MAAKRHHWDPPGRQGGTKTCSDCDLTATRRPVTVRAPGVIACGGYTTEYAQGGRRWTADHVPPCEPAAQPQLPVPDRTADADTMDHAAGLAYRRGEFDEALRLLTDARVLDPSRVGLWAEREARVQQAGIQAARQQQHEGGLTAELASRQAAAGITPDDPALARIGSWNRLMFARADMQYPPPQMEAGS